MNDARQASAQLLEVEGLTKAYPGVLANDAVSFSVAEGEIHALLGENGAGKSTLVKMIYGVVRPDAGAMRFKGAPYAPARPADARARGIGMVFQHFSLFDALTVEENIALGIAAELAGKDLGRRIVEISTRYGLPLDPARHVADLSVGVRQRVEIVRCLLQNPRLVIMDEPTSVLTPQEVDTLFETLRRLAGEGCAILYISHKLEEIRALCHHATILRGGRVVATCTPANETAKSLAEMMIGDVVMPAHRVGGAAGRVRLKLDRLSTEAGSAATHAVVLRDISLEVRAGEVVGIAGVAGNGQDELMAALNGETPAARADAVLIDDTPAGLLGPEGRRRLGLSSVPEERLGHAAVPDMSLIENTLLSGRSRRGLERSGFLDLARATNFAREVVAAFDVRTAGVEHAARSLSGGNLQKYTIGREILQAPGVLIAAQPTWGVDAGAAARIREALMRLAGEGAAVVVISQDLDELFEISDRIAVIANGRLTEAEPVGSLSVEQIGLRMGGGGDGGPRRGGVSGDATGEADANA